MRLRFAAAALAALALAAPAAAQRNAVEVMRGMMQRLDANTEGVENYTLTLRSGPMEAEVYVYRDGDEWEVASGDDDQMGGVLRAVVVWPTFDELEDELPEGELSAEDLEELSEIATVSSEMLDGRPADVLFVRMAGLVEDGEMPDSVRVFVDPRSNQILRVHVAGSSEGMGDFAPGGGNMEVSMDFADYRETGGLTVPHSLRMRMSVDMALTDEQKEIMREGIAAARAELAEDDSPEGRQTAAMIEMFMGLLTDGRMDLPVTVENVRVNAGPPAWFDG